MIAKDNMRTAAEVLVDQLVVNGVRHVFCVPGESYLAVLDAFHDRDITVTVCRQEGGAAMMADAVGKATGRPGPVVISLPEDMLTERVAVADAPPFEPVETWPGQADMAKLEQLLADAER